MRRGGCPEGQTGTWLTVAGGSPVDELRADGIGQLGYM